jgi:hypothetical protein
VLATLQVIVGLNAPANEVLVIVELVVALTYMPENKRRKWLNRKPILSLP